jgi:hypothetical protein
VRIFVFGEADFVGLSGVNDLAGGGVSGLERLALVEQLKSPPAASPSNNLVFAAHPFRYNQIL